MVIFRDAQHLKFCIIRTLICNKCSTRVQKGKKSQVLIQMLLELRNIKLSIFHHCILSFLALRYAKTTGYKPLYKTQKCETRSYLIYINQKVGNHLLLVGKKYGVSLLFCIFGSEHSDRLVFKRKCLCHLAYTWFNCSFHIHPNDFINAHCMWFRNLTMSNMVWNQLLSEPNRK